MSTRPALRLSCVERAFQEGRKALQARDMSAATCCYAVKYRRILFLARPCFTATPTFRELAFVLLSITAPPNIAFDKVWWFFLAKSRNQFHRSIVSCIVHYPHRWESIRGNRHFTSDSVLGLTTNFNLDIFSLQQHLQ